MMWIIKTGIILFLIVWMWLGVKLIINYSKLFGPHPDDPSESSGARSFGVAHIIAVWVGGFCLAVYFLFK